MEVSLHEPLVGKSGRDRGDSRDTDLSDFAAGKPAAVRPDTEGGDGSGKPRDVVGFWELFRFADTTDKLLMLFGFLMAFANGAILPAFSIIFGNLLDAMNKANQGPHTILHNVRNDAKIFLYFGAGTLVLSFCQFCFFQAASERQITRIRKRFIGSLLRQNVSWFDTNSAGEVSSRLAEDTEVMQTGIGEKLGFTIQQLSQFVCGIGLAFYHGWLLASVLIAFIPVLGCAAGVLVVLLGKYSKGAADAYAKASVVATQAISMIRTVVAFSGERTETQRYRKYLGAAERMGIAKGRALGLAVGFIMMTLMCMFGVGMWFGTRMIIDSRNSCIRHAGQDCHIVTGGDIITVFFSVVMAGFGLAAGAPNIGLVSAARSSAARIYDVIALRPTIDPTDPSGIKPSPDSVRAAISFRNINFAYPSRPHVQVLKDFSLDIEPGTTVALVGSSGSGKSTIVSLLQRFYQPASGSIQLDGVEVSDLNLKWLREQIGVVSQEPSLFATSIQENIAYGVVGRGGPKPTFNEVVGAARMANAHRFISRFPSGYDTLVGEKGAQLSGGQKQRVSIARAMLRNPKILLLDEATSALDTKSERVVQAALDKLIADGSSRTTIVIAHRLSTVINADKIVVMHLGKIVEMGTHAELMAADGRYKQMHDLQMLHDPSAVKAVDPSAGDAGAGAGADEAKAGDDGDETEGEEDDDDAPKPATKADMTPKLPSGKPAPDTPKDVPFSRVFAYQRPELFILVLAIIGSACNGTVMPMFSIIFSDMTQVFYLPPAHEDEMRARSIKFLLAFVGIGVGSLIMYYLQIWGMTLVGERLTRRLRARTYEALMRQEVGYFDLKENSTGRLTSRLSSDAALVRTTTGDRIGTLLQNNVAVVAALIIAFYSCWQLTLIVLSVVPFMVLGGWLQVRLTRRRPNADMEDNKSSFEKASAFASEALAAIRTVAAFGLQPLMKRQFDDALVPTLSEGLRKAVIGGIGLGYSSAVVMCSYALAFWYGAEFVTKGYTSFPGMLRVFYALTLAGTGVGQNSSYQADAEKAVAAKQSIFTIIDRASKVDASVPAGIRPSRVKGDIEFVHVSFCYPSRPDEPILRDLNLKISAGTDVALVGPSGSGKSTIIQLLQRFYDPDGGVILLDGVDLRNYNLRWLRSYYGLVSQEPSLFDDTIDKNIQYGRPRLDEPFGTFKEFDAEGKPVGQEQWGQDPGDDWAGDGGSTGSDGDGDGDGDGDALEAGLLKGRTRRGPIVVDRDVMDAAQTANAAQFISELSDGFGTRTGDQGAQMSGGQKQRIAIARALVRDPQILLLDEATSALDSHSERVVQEALDNVVSGGQSRTSVIIAHRLSSIRGVDRIVVLNRGEVAETGTHDDLVASDGLYAALVRAQDV